ncbi:MAG TPA: 2-iminoacetate synthase ThiH [Firmicutes bacterium]|nr:2-iminoacetate synthase ThiH [Bacillota bacterium]
MTKKRLNHMEYLDWMELIETDIMDRVLRSAEAYLCRQYTGREVESALVKDHLSPGDFCSLLSPAAMPYLEDMAVKARLETRKKFGNCVHLFTPLYISNYCDNYCIYCGFNCRNKICRGILSLDEVEAELEAIAATGLKDILLLTGENRSISGIEYLGEAVKLAASYFPAVGIEVYPLNVAEYLFLNKCGADFVSVYQETYNPQRYAQVHRGGPKRSYPYRFHAQERALLGNMHGVAFGALLGLGDYHQDAFAAGLHAYFIQQKYPHSEISLSVPRLRPYINNRELFPHEVSEKQLLQVMLAYRLFMPYAGITISTRERATFRDHAVGMAATRISASVKVGVGGHKQKEKGDQQFCIADTRSVKDVHQMIVQKGLQPVYTDHVRV